MRLLSISIGIFFGLAIMGWPFPYQFFSFHLEGLLWIYGQLPFADTSAWALSSDSRALWQWMGFLAVVALLLGFAVNAWPAARLKWAKLEPWLRLLGSYYLFFILSQYGLQKVFKWQFYLSEPNILYTPVGQLDPDILFWTTMGTNYGYNVFLGALECLPALLLLWRRTRLLGLLLAWPVLVHILALNVSYNISVKALSIFLLALETWLLAPYLPYLWQMSVGEGRLARPTGAYPAENPYRRGLKVLVLSFLLLELFWPYWRSGNFQDDLAPRPPLHGAYELVDGPVVWPLDPNRLCIRRLFVHRRGYLIVQTTDDQFWDYPLALDYNRNEWHITDAQANTYTFRMTQLATDSLWQLKFNHLDTVDALPLRSLDWRALPALNGKLDWVSF